MWLTKQTFNEPGTGKAIYEYAKPVFENNQKTGTVRIGFQVPEIVVFKGERLSHLSMIVFLILATIILFYYGVLIVIKPLQKIMKNSKKIIHSSVPESNNGGQGTNIVNIIGELNKSFSNIQDRITRIESENIELSTKMGAISFEKDQIINLLNSLSFGIITTDLHDNINYINDYISNLIGRQLKDVLDQPFDQIIENDDIALSILQFEQIETAGNGKNIETTFPNFSPGETFGVSLYNLTDKSGESIGKMILVKNITFQKMGEKTQQEFISHVSHELLTPLTTIKSYNEMLMDGEIDKEEMQKEFYNTISEETSRLTRLIQNLLNISRIETGELVINRDFVRTELLFEDCAAAINASALNKNISFQKLLPDTFPSLNGDKELLKVSINNILNNAVKYTPEGGRISFSLYEYNNTVTFEVINTGGGISKNDIPRIFDKSYRSDDKHVSEQYGSGLGLAITSEIINLHGGEVEVQSEPGKETCFKINIPKGEYYLEDK
ncbi:multi-sensor signal transduction histidine kinase [Candidatus Scalindua japonica]|uniref:histidine kinase n=2 Tax=Candidatus Scalindua japonica TaxID=1284222 RepID=A0A286TTI9_9BACT|nr:multi-sensor signal transduction histidine kinase [Candidatus Scalindua japonica]